MSAFLKSGFILLSAVVFVACGGSSGGGGEDLVTTLSADSPIVNATSSASGEAVELEVVDFKVAVITIE